MKQVSTIFFLLILSAATFSQQTQPARTLTKQDYLKKSKNQKTIAWILLGGGAALVITGAAIPSHVTDYGDPLNPYDDKYSNNWAALSGIGGLSMLGSIPLFIIASKNKRRAASVSFKNQFAPQVTNYGFVKRSVPSLNLKINL